MFLICGWATIDLSTCRKSIREAKLLQFLYCLLQCAKLTMILSSGIALLTQFVITCFGWKNHGDDESDTSNLLYRFWATPTGTEDTQVVIHCKPRDRIRPLSGTSTQTILRR